MYVEDDFDYFLLIEIIVVVDRTIFLIQMDLLKEYIFWNTISLEWYNFYFNYLVYLINFGFRFHSFQYEQIKYFYIRPIKYITNIKKKINL